MLSKEHALTLAGLLLATATMTLAIDLLRTPAWRAFELLWVWWATGPSHYFGF